MGEREVQNLANLLEGRVCGLIERAQQELRWKVSNAEATRFARAIGFSRQNKKLLRKGQLYAKILNLKHS